ncbi:MAG: hypothetical protein C0483_04970 [Pirellula sp.]|nr:hypothetical protein [Pirellula sp.]
MVDSPEPNAADSVNSLRPKLLEASPHGYILIVHDEASDEWVIDLDERMDGVLVAQILEAFQSQMVRCIQQQARVLDAEVGQITAAPIPAARVDDALPDAVLPGTALPATVLPNTALPVIMPNDGINAR